jgi:hypothetical protein
MALKPVRLMTLGELYGAAGNPDYASWHPDIEARISTLERQAAEGAKPTSVIKWTFYTDSSRYAIEACDIETAVVKFNASHKGEKVGLVLAEGFDITTVLADAGDDALE